ncbi:MAG: peptide chain release factor family protein [Candidatus Aminicenantales bacterium]
MPGSAGHRMRSQGDERSGMAFSGVSKEKEEALSRRMEALGIFEKDIVEKFIRSSGKGGQRLNKASTCVYLKHLPTRIEVKCQKERYQGLNRYLARKILANKVEAMILGKKSAEQQRIAKIRRQKRKRSKRAKEKMLEEKRIRSEKKKERSFRPSPEDFED